MIGLTFSFGNIGIGCFLENISDYGRLTSAPECLFETVDPRVSKFWELKLLDNGDILLWPPSFYQDYYHDDLSEGVPEIVSDFKRVYQMLEKESMM